MNCEICEIQFDHHSHKPLCLIPCTHTYCINCINKLIRHKCPKCASIIQKTNPNWSLISLLEIENEVDSNTELKNKNKIFETSFRNAFNIDNSGEACLFFNIGLEKYYQKDYKEAVEAYDKAIKINPNNFLAYNNKGIALKELKDYTGAIDSFNKAIEIEPFEKAFNNLGRLYYDIKNYKKSIECFDKAIDVNEKYTLAYHNRGLANASLKNYAAAISDFNIAIKLDELYYESYIAKGLAIKHLKQENDFNNNSKFIVK